jgi:Ca2+-binding EF-hand superfamily protein
MWNLYDLDKSGTLSKEDCIPLFKQLIANRPDLGLTEDDQGKWFDGIDLDKDDTISMDEMKAYLATVSYTHHHH